MVHKTQLPGWEYSSVVENACLMCLSPKLSFQHCRNKQNPHQTTQDLAIKWSLVCGLFASELNHNKQYHCSFVLYETDPRPHQNQNSRLFKSLIYSTCMTHIPFYYLKHPVKCKCHIYMTVLFREWREKTNNNNKNRPYLVLVQSTHHPRSVQPASLEQNPCRGWL